MVGPAYCVLLQVVRHCWLWSGSCVILATKSCAILVTKSCVTYMSQILVNKSCLTYISYINYS